MELKIRAKASTYKLNSSSPPMHIWSLQGEANDVQGLSRFRSAEDFASTNPQRPLPRSHCETDVKGHLLAFAALTRRSTALKLRFWRTVMALAG